VDPADPGRSQQGKKSDFASRRRLLQLAVPVSKGRLFQGRKAVQAGLANCDDHHGPRRGPAVTMDH